MTMMLPELLRSAVTEAGLPLAALRRARSLSQRAVRQIAAGIRPGMTHAQATALAAATLQALEMERNWHPVAIRFGEDTLKTARDASDPARVLGEQDIFFIDIGPVWEGHEGDAGETFVVGGDPQMEDCARTVRAIWHEVSSRLCTEGLDGEALYAYATQRAQARGWRLNLGLHGHRVGDFPPAIPAAGRGPGLWVLEIQIAHPTRPFGAFHKDLLVADEAMHEAAC
ncbi:M24 family metallopeptidase [Variovorax sp. DAIF25]|uniref:M24 family metallopeptidase n=1 Tax=Variovorax sp. DAIF25 TaxID=3080983 RepID=UPI003D6B9F0C